MQKQYKDSWMGTAFRYIEMSPLRCFTSAPDWAQKHLSRGDSCEGTSLHTPPRQYNEEPLHSTKKLMDSSHPKIICVFLSLLELTKSSFMLPTNMYFPEPELSLKVYIFWCSISRGYFPVLGDLCRVRGNVDACPFL